MNPIPTQDVCLRNNGRIALLNPQTHLQQEEGGDTAGPLAVFKSDTQARTYGISEPLPGSPYRQWLFRAGRFGLPLRIHPVH